MCLLFVIKTFLITLKQKVTMMKKISERIDFQAHCEIVRNPIALFDNLYVYYVHSAFTRKTNTNDGRP